MDRPRPVRGLGPRQRRWALAFVVTFAIAGLTLALSRLPAAIPTIDADDLWIDSVERGSLVREVHGRGTLISEAGLWIPARTSGRVERLRVLPGVTVDADTVLIELSNPDLELAARQAATDVAVARAELESLRVQLENDRLDREGKVASLRAELRRAELQAGTDERLAAQGLVAAMTLQQSKIVAEELAALLEIERQRVAAQPVRARAQLDAQRARVEQLEATHDLRKSQLAGLHLRAGRAGVVQQVLAQVGQQVEPGTDLARLTSVAALKAQLQVAPTAARELAPGLPATVAVLGVQLAARVSRVDPSVVDGMVTVDLELSGDLPRGARPDLQVDGAVQLERIEDVLHVRRPPLAREESESQLFRLTSDGRAAERVTIRLGRSSAESIEVVSGLQEHDRLILSDMTRWNDHPRLRLNR